MAQRNSSGRGGAATATKNRPAATRSTTKMAAARSGPTSVRSIAAAARSNAGQIREADIAQLRVDDLRGELRRRGVVGTSGLRKEDLVKQVAKQMRADLRRGGEPARRAPSPGPTSKSSTAKKSTSASARKTISAPARKTTSAAAARKSTSTGAARKSTSATGGAIRKGSGTSRSMKYAQRIDSIQDQPERAGRSLVTTNHDVIKRWAQARQAKPATIRNTDRDNRPGVLRLEFPGFQSSPNMVGVTWNQWFRTFDERQLNFVYQERLRNGQPSNFFLLESPWREDG